MSDSLFDIQRPDRRLGSVIQERLDNLTKPPGSLGRLESLALEYGIMRGTPDLKLTKAAVVTFAADHGISKCGVSAYPREVTPQMVANLVSGGAAICVLCRHYGIDHFIVDVGVDFDFGDVPGLRNHKIAHGTNNFLEQDAMTREQALASLRIGAEFADGYDCMGTGEMGIGNTTASAAILTVLGKCPIEDAVGRGTGLDDEGVRRKTEVVRGAIEARRPGDDPLDVLTKLGGFEIGAIAGLILGAASRRIPVVVDGFISGAAALVATRLRPECREYLVFSHVSRERGHRRMLEILGAKPLLDLDLCLGEGTGAAIGIDLLRAAVRLYNEMATFEEAAVSSKQ